MNLCLIWAQAHDRVIGRANTLPWHAPEDLKHFKALTAGHPIVMGRRTWESLPRKPLPGRQNFVISRQSDGFDGAIRCASLSDAIQMAATAAPPRLFVIGGQALYEEAIRVADTLFVTQVDEVVSDADAFAPAIDESRFELADQVRSTADPRLTFETYYRRRIV
jgi:dihydrofolate reductase